jgi:hypothetical protein
MQMSEINEEGKREKTAKKVLLLFAMSVHEEE